MLIPPDIAHCALSPPLQLDVVNTIFLSQLDFSQSHKLVSECRMFSYLEKLKQKTKYPAGSPQCRRDVNKVSLVVVVVPWPGTLSVEIYLVQVGSFMYANS